MQAPELTRQVRHRLLELLGDERLDGPTLLRRLRAMRRLERVPACSAALHLLAHVDLPEDEGELLLEELLQHRRALAASLERDPGLPVAAIDFLCNVRPLLANPTIVEQAELERTERSAFTDSLTRMYNRRYFQLTFDVEVRRSARYGLQLALVMLDLDGFKPVNDRHGHLLGDLVLKRTGGLIRRSVRETDVAVRFGGEEFAIVLPETGRNGALVVAERIRVAVEGHFRTHPVQERSIAVTLSGGIATYPADGVTATTLLARADEALYLAKTRGRNRIVAHHAERRRSVRYPARSNATANIRVRRDPVERRARPLNLSLDGALLATRGEYAPADPIELTLGGPEAGFVVHGRVVRLERDAAASEGRVAVAFDRPLPPELLRAQVRAVRPLAEEPA